MPIGVFTNCGAVLLGGVLAILVGFTIGHLLHLEFWTSRFFHKLVKVMHLGGDDIDMEFFVMPFSMLWTALMG